MADVTSINQIVITAKDETGQAFQSASSGVKKVGADVDGLNSQLRALKGEFANLDKALQQGRFANAGGLTDQVYKALNEQIAKTKGLIDQVSSASKTGFTEAAGHADRLNLATAGVTREFIVLGHEALQGNFSRIPGSILVLLERMGNLHTLLTSTTAVWGGVAAAIGLVILAMVKGAEEAAAMNQAISATGNYAGVTRGQMLALATQMSDTERITIGASKEIVTQLVASGKVGADAIGGIAKLAAEYARQTGEDLSSVGKDLAKLFSDPTKGARDLIESFGGVSVAQEEYIRHLQQQGEVGQAQLVLAEALKAKLEQQQQPLGALQKLWQGVKDAASGAWDAMLGIGRPKTLAQLYSDAVAAAASLNRISQENAQFGRVGGPDFPASASGQQASLDAARTQVDYARENLRLANQQADAEGRIAAVQRLQLQAQDEINKGQMGHIKDLNDSIKLIRDAAAAAREPISQEGLQRIAQLQKEIASTYRAMDADHRAQIEAQISEQQKLADVGLDADTDMLNAQLKLGQITQIEHDRRMTQIALERNENAISATQRLLQISSLDAKERASYQARLSLLAAQRELIQQQGDNKVLEDMRALDDVITKIHGEVPSFASDFLDLQNKLAQAYNEGRLGIVGSVEALQKYAQLTNELFAQQPFEVRWRQAQAAIEKANGAFEDFIDRLKDGLEKQQQAIDNLGKMPDEIARANAELHVQQQIDKELNDLATAYAAALQKNPALAAALLTQINNLLDVQGRLVTQAGDLAENYSKAKRELDDWKSVLSGLADEGAKFIEDFVQHGSSAFKNLWDDFKKWALEAFAKLAAQTLIINIAAAFGGTSQAAANQLFGQGGSQSNPLLNLLGGGKTSNFLTSGFGSFATSGIGQTLGLSEAVGGSAGIAADAVGLIPGGVAADIGLTSAGSAISSFLAAAGPFIPFVAAAIPLLGSLFSHDPSQVHARFNITPTGTGAGTNEGGAGGTVSSPYGDLGFNNADTMYFSGSAGTALSNIVLGALQAFQPRLSGEQNQRLTQTLQSTDFGTFEGSYTTEDFIKQYGGDILKKVVVAAFHELDPALESVAANFTGTADDIAKFANSLLAIHDATQAVGNADFTKNVDAALQGADQATVDKVLAFVTIVQGAGSALDGLSQHMQALDPAEITKFVDALGGAQQALQGLAYINANFTTSAQQAQQAQANLDKAWTVAGVTMDDLAHAGLTALPQTHEQFLALVNSLDLNTQHGRDLAASLINNVAPAFVAVQGTAEAAAQALLQQAQAGRDYYTQHFLTPEEQTQQRIGLDETTLYNMTKQGTLLNGVLHDMGYDVIPSTVEGVRQWHDAVIAKYGADSDEAHAMEATIPIIGDLIDATNGWGDAATNAANRVNDAIASISHPVDVDQYLAGVTTNIGNITNLADQTIGTLGDKLSTRIALLGNAIAKTEDQIAAAGANNDYSRITYLLQPQLSAYEKANAAATDELARFTVLAAQYDAARAEQLVELQDWYTAQQKLFAGQGDVLAATKAIFDQKWNGIVNGTQTAVTAVQQTIEDFIKSLDSLVDQSHGNAGQRLSIEAAAGFSKVQELVAQLAAVPAGSPQAASIQSDITKLSVFNGRLVNYIADFTTLTAQYGTDIANQLVALEQWRDTEKDTLRSLISDPTQLANALATVDQIVSNGWKDIIDGTKSGVDDMKKALQGLADYLKGLFTSDVSPLKPGEQFAFEKTLFDTTFAKAQGGDIQAVNDLPKIADTLLHLGGDFLSVSSEAFRELFATVTTDLGNLAGTQPNGLPLDSNAAIVSALPVNSKLASSEDIETLKEAMTELETAVADANSEDLADVKALLLRIANSLTSTTSPLRANA